MLCDEASMQEFFGTSKSRATEIAAHRVMGKHIHVHAGQPTAYTCTTTNQHIRCIITKSKQTRQPLTILGAQHVKHVVKLYRGSNSGMGHSAEADASPS